MIIKTYYVEDPMSNEFIEAMEELSELIPCFLELVDINAVYVEARAEDLCTVERVFAPYV